MAFPCCCGNSRNACKKDNQTNVWQQKWDMSRSKWSIFTPLDNTLNTILVPLMQTVQSWRHLYTWFDPNQHKMAPHPQFPDCRCSCGCFKPLATEADVVMKCTRNAREKSSRYKIYGQREVLQECCRLALSAYTHTHVKKHPIARVIQCTHPPYILGYIRKYCLDLNSGLCIFIRFNSWPLHNPTRDGLRSADADFTQKDAKGFGIQRINV